MLNHFVTVTYWHGATGVRQGRLRVSRGRHRAVNSGEHIRGGDAPAQAPWMRSNRRDACVGLHIGQPRRDGRWLTMAAIQGRVHKHGEGNDDADLDSAPSHPVSLTPITYIMSIKVRYVHLINH